MKAVFKYSNDVQKPIVKFDVIKEDDYSRVAIMHPGFKPTDKKRLYLVEKDSLVFFDD